MISLVRRDLSPRDDPGWLSMVEFGPEPWSQEVEMFLRGEAVLREEQGDCHTSLFLLPGDDRIIGFMSVTFKDLEVDKEFRHLFGMSSRKAPRSPVSAAYLAAIGTDRRHRGNGYATQMHLALVEEISQGLAQPRFVVLQVWEDSPAVDLYVRWGYQVLSTTSTDRFGEKVGRHKMVLDRFSAVAGLAEVTGR